MIRLTSLLKESISSQNHTHIGNILSSIPDDSLRRQIVKKFVELLKKDNTLFNEKLFMKICRVKPIEPDSYGIGNRPGRGN